MNRSERFLISIWRNGEHEPETECVVFPAYTSAAAETDLLRSELEDMKGDGLIDRYSIIEQPCDDIDMTEASRWIAQVRKEQE